MPDEVSIPKVARDMARASRIAAESLNERIASAEAGALDVQSAIAEAAAIAAQAATATATLADFIEQREVTHRENLESLASGLWESGSLPSGRGALQCALCHRAAETREFLGRRVCALCLGDLKERHG